MKIYRLDSGEEEPEWFATKREAVKEARFLAPKLSCNQEIIVTWFEIARLDRKTLCLALLNRSGWASATGDVLVLHGQTDD